jgi:TolA-binding protein
LIGGALLALSATGCFATKGDIRLVQEEIRAARASAAQADSARRRTSDSLTAALANLARVQALAARDAQQTQQKNASELTALKNADIGTREQLKAINADLDQLHEITRQNARGQTLTRAQLEQANAARQAAATPPDTMATATDSTAAPPPSGPPGPATLLVQGRSLVYQGSCATARRDFQDVITQYPDSPEAAEAMYSIAGSYTACGDGNPARADSVYRLVIEKYPRSDFAPMSYYKRAEALRDAGNMAEARPLYAKIVCDYPKSTVVAQAVNRLGNQRPACR